ncbi:WLM-domain-containing protein [Leucogyrophana mollusca]|uniref:WLM-domain-containing protein n=1 Tax=Leucogyrophana mollusca TaxID=85980 RepID=A0ACB8BC50_9AGAM|nr:WLM-domain-containing protein [Leucogyrophana mollusca]
MSETFVKSFTHLKDRPKADRALPMLQRIASLVKPIMRKHGWVLPMLSEFFPDSPNLVDVNGGEQILLRLRPAWAPDTFYDEDQVVRVMLHELTHNVHGPHDEKFYKFLAGLEDEYDALQRSGYAGEGFFSKGQRLGTNVSHDLPPHLARARALEAAEKRRKAGIMLNGGGRLGGRVGAMRGMTPRELAAQAAERRQRDEVACGSGAAAQKEAAKVSKESVQDIIDLTDDGPVPGPSRASRPSASSSVFSRAQPDSGSSRPPGRPNVTRDSSRLGPYPRVKPTDRPIATGGQWSCSACTLINEPLALQCAVCFSERPRDPSSGWTCLTCGEGDMPHEFWSCRFCGSIKTESVVG